MFYNEFDKTVDYFYKCNTCRKLFISDNNGILERFIKKKLFLVNYLQFFTLSMTIYLF